MVSTNCPKLSLCLMAAVLLVGSAAFVPNAPRNQHKTQLSAKSGDQERRSFLAQLASASAMVLLPSMPSNAGLLDEFGADPNKIVIKDKVAEKPAGLASKGQGAIDPTLRASYYYPTAKKRYLPRIQKVTARINEIPQCIADGQWEEVQVFAATADNAVLPLQLYVSSLDGQGLGMANSYAKTMKKDAEIFEKQYKILQKAMKTQDQDMALAAVQQMGIAVAEYRQAGRLSDDDGNIPSVDEIKRSTMRRTTQAQFALNQ